MNIPLLIGAFLGLTSVMMAAFADHSLASHLTSYSFILVLKAIKYHELYAVVITMIGLSISLNSDIKIKSWLIRTAFLFTVGTFIFSGSLYVRAIFLLQDAVKMTPYGGTILMIAWLSLIRTAFLKVKSSKLY